MCGGISRWFRPGSERFRRVAALSISTSEFLSPEHCRCWFGRGACEGDEGKTDLWHAINDGGPHRSDVAVLELNVPKSDAVFNIFYSTSAINEIFPCKYGFHSN